MKQIILYKAGSIVSGDLAILKSEGYLPVACKDPNDVSLLFPDGHRLRGDAIFQAAINSIAGPNSGQERERFAFAIIRSLANQKP